MQIDKLTSLTTSRPVVLLVEDNSNQTQYTKEALEKGGFEVVIPTSDTMALEYIKQGDPDLVLISDSELMARVTAALRARKAQREMARLARMLYTVNQVGQQLAGILNLKELLESVVRLIKENFDYPHVHVYLHQIDKLVLAAAADYPEVAIDQPAGGWCVDLHSDNPAAVTALNGQIQLLTKMDFTNKPHPIISDAQSGIVAPIHTAAHISGVLEIVSAVESAFSPNDRLVLQTLADLVGVAVHNSRLYQELTSLATRDELTGLRNRRSIMNHFEAEFAHSQSQNQDLSIIMVDIDGFKQVNDWFGHPAGDRALQAVAESIQHTIRRHDLAGRVGGEEFLIVLPETNRWEATSIADRLRQTCEMMTIDVGVAVPIRLTISLGVANWPETEVNESSGLIKAVDQALYEAKAAGRNTVAVHENSRQIPASRSLNLLSKAISS